jgi:hypothetical protein
LKYKNKTYQRKICERSSSSGSVGAGQQWQSDLFARARHLKIPQIAIRQFCLAARQIRTS